MSVPQLQELLKQYRDARHLAGFSGPNDVILQVGAYVAETPEKAYSEPQASTMHRVRVIQQHLHQVGDQETYERLKRSSDVTYDELLPRLAFGTPEAVAEKLQQYREDLGITGISVDVNPGGQIPHEKVMNSLRLFAEEVMPGSSRQHGGMKIKYFQDADTLDIELRREGIVESRDLDENTVLDLDSGGNTCAITVEHASDRTGLRRFWYEQMAT
jgi:uncharacterized protein YuzE